MEVRCLIGLPLDDLPVVVRELGVTFRAGPLYEAPCVNRRPGGKWRPGGSQDLKRLSPGVIHMDIKYLPQTPNETARRYLFVTNDCATRRVFMRCDAEQSEVSSTDFLRRLKVAAPMRIEKLVTGNESQFTARFTSKGKQPSGKHVLKHEYVLLGIEHRLIRQRHPRTNGMVERFNGRISAALATTRFRSRQDFQTALGR